jgi:hypothetical protein
MNWEPCHRKWGSELYHQIFFLSSNRTPTTTPNKLAVAPSRAASSCLFRTRKLRHSPKMRRSCISDIRASFHGTFFCIHLILPILQADTHLHHRWELWKGAMSIHPRIPYGFSNWTTCMPYVHCYGAKKFITKINYNYKKMIKI